MAAFIRKYATATHIYIPMVKRAVVDFAVSADWTPVAGDVKIKIDTGAAANIGTLPVAVTMGNTALWDFVFTTGEMTGAKIIVTVADSSTKAVEDQAIEIETYGNASAQQQPDYSDIVRMGLTALPNAAAEAAGGLYTRGSGAGQINQNANGQIDGRVVSFAAGSLPIKKNTALAKFMFIMYDSTDHITPKTGLGAGITCQRAINGNAFANCNTVNATEISNGVYYLDLAASDLNGDTIMFKFTATGADATYVPVITQ